MERRTVCVVGVIIVVGGLFAFAGEPDSPSAIRGPGSEDCKTHGIPDDCDIANGAETPLPHIATVGIDCGGSDGPYWLGVDGSSNHLFVLSDSQCEGDNWGIHVYDLLDGGNDLIFNQTLFGSEGPSSDCYGALTVSESTDRLFAIDYCDGCTVDIYDTATLNFLGSVPVERTGEEPLMLSVGHFSGAGGTLDDQIFISDAEMLRVSDIATLNPIADVSVTLGTCSTPGSGFECPGFDDGKHMVVDTLGERIFVSDHDEPFIVFDFSSPPEVTQIFPTVGVQLCEPLGIAPLPDGKLLITDEDTCVGGLFRLNSDLSLDAEAEVPGDSGCSAYNPEGVVYDAVHERIYVADEDCDEIEIFGFGESSGDCNDNGIPDECEEDCNTNGVPDDCDIDDGTSPDRNSNGIPDECEPECSGPEECEDGNECTDDACVDGECVNTPNTNPCNDGNACTMNDTCDGAGNCVGSGVVCDDQNDCTTDTCNPGKGCVFTPDIGETCDDGDACTENDTCDQDGNCEGTDLDCDDGDLCTIDGCADGECVHTEIDCGEGEICEDGECVPQAECESPEDCDDGDACTTDDCVAEECVNTEIECPQGEVCVDGECQPQDDPCAPGPDGKVTICHIPPGNPENAQTISVSPNALPAHLRHGDYCGPCEQEGGLPSKDGDAPQESSASPLLDEPQQGQPNGRSNASCGFGPPLAGLMTYCLTLLRRGF